MKQDNLLFGQLGGCVSLAAVVALYEWHGGPWWKFLEGLAVMTLAVFILQAVGMAAGMTAVDRIENKWLRWLAWLAWMAGMVLLYAFIGKKFK